VTREENGELAAGVSRGSDDGDLSHGCAFREERGRSRIPLSRPASFTAVSGETVARKTVSSPAIDPTTSASSA
jgi:hypothetical protein